MRALGHAEVFDGEAAGRLRHFTLTRYVGVRGDPRQQLTVTTDHW
jgi:hypothetical protein